MVSYCVVPICIMLLLGGIFGIVFLRSSLISLEYRISDLEKQRLEALREAKTLMAEKSSVLSLHKVQKTASSQFGLVFPNRTKVVFVARQTPLAQQASHTLKEGASGAGAAGKETL